MLQQIKKHFSTWNGAKSYASPTSTNEYEGIQSLYFKGIRQIDDDTAEKYFFQAYKEDPVLTTLIVFNIRDCRGGKGERKLGRLLLNILRDHDEEVFNAVFKLIPEYGRWDDLIDIFLNTQLPYYDEDNDSKMLFQHIRKQLNEDVKSMNDGKPCSILAKWLPNEKSKLSNSTDFVRLYCRWSHISFKAYRKTLSQLRSYMKVVEVLICNGKWKEVDYSKVPSLAMKRLKKAFEKHCPDEFKEWREKLESGKVKVCAKQLYPHELVHDTLLGNYDSVAEAQWKVLFEETKKLGTFKNSLVLSDVSGSMTSSAGNICPIDASIALGIMIANCTEGYFNKKVITFETVPQFVNLKGENLKEDVSILKKSPWGGSTNIQAVFDLILDAVMKNKVPISEFPKTLYILSDMQFNQADCNLTNFEVIEKKFRNHNLVMPKIIFWNLNGSTNDFPCTSDKNVLMISGFSTAILKNIMKYGECDNISLIKALLEDERYKPVHDAVSLCMTKNW